MYDLGITAKNPVIPKSHIMNNLPGVREIVTHRNIMFRDVTEQWLSNNSFTYDKIHFIDGFKSMVGPFDYFIEDCPDNAIDLSQNTRTVFLIDHIYNKNIKLPSNVIRVKEWSEIHSFIKKEL